MSDEGAAVWANRMRQAGVAALAWLALGTPLAEPGPADVSRSWEGAVVYVPDKAFPTSVDALPTEVAHPVVLFLHGCAGIKQGEKAWAYFLKNAGYLVVLPDSFARERPPSCDPATKRFGLFRGALAFRRDEIRFALEQLERAAWADRRNIFLMGHSQGGVLAALADFPALRGVVISGWPCVGTDGTVDGIRVPPQTPLLVLNHQQDPWYGYAAGRRCSEFFADRREARETILDGTGHDTFDATAREAVLDFLTRHRHR